MQVNLVILYTCTLLPKADLVTYTDGNENPIVNIVDVNGQQEGLLRSTLVASNPRTVPSIMMAEEELPNHVEEAQEEIPYPEQVTGAEGGEENQDECIYQNLCTRIAHDDLEAYLSWAMFSPDTDQEFSVSSKGRLADGSCSARFLFHSIFFPFSLCLFSSTLSFPSVSADALVTLNMYSVILFYLFIFTVLQNFYLLLFIRSFRSEFSLTVAFLSSECSVHHAKELFRWRTGCELQEEQIQEQPSL